MRATKADKTNRRVIASNASDWVALIMTAGETVDVETLLERRQLTTDKQKSACVAQFAEWIETESDSDLRYPRDWSWVLDQSGLAADLRNRLEPSDEPLAHQAGSAFRKHSYRLQAIRLFGNGIN